MSNADDENGVISNGAFHPTLCVCIITTRTKRGACRVKLPVCEGANTDKPYSHRKILVRRELKNVKLKVRGNKHKN